MMISDSYVNEESGKISFLLEIKSESILVQIKLPPYEPCLLDTKQFSVFGC